MNSSSGKSAAVSSSTAGKSKNEVITIDLCLSDTDDEHELGFKSPSSSVAAAAASSLKRTTNPGKQQTKSKRPKPDPAAFANDIGDSDVEIIEITDDEDDDDGKPSATASAAAFSTPATCTAGTSKSPARGMQGRSVTLSVEGAAMMASRTMAKEEPTAENRKKDAGDDEVELVYVPSNSGWRQVSATAAASAGAENTGTGNTASVSASGRTGRLKDDRAYETNAESKVDDDDEEEFELVATKGTNALIDFPHSRENCVQFSFANGDKKAHCDNCYCYVCDIPAKDCKKWNEHCQACHGERRWREERERFKRLGIEAASAAAQPAAAAAATAAAATVSTAATAPRMAISTSAFMNNRPTGFSMRPVIPPNAHYSNRPNLPRYSISALLEQLTIVHPVEATPPENRFSTNLRHYQKQSLAFMKEVEKASGPSPFMKKGVRGGFLCDQVGMGKSAVVLALIASSPSQTITSDDVESQKRLRWSKQPIQTKKLKATVIMTSCSLLGQWEDECRKHAPKLVVRVAHPSRKPSHPTTFNYLSTQELHKIDVILTTSTYPWTGRCPKFFDLFRFHRVVVDESHLFGTSSANLESANIIKASRRWCVTATPCTSSVGELYRQLSFLGGIDGFPGRNFDIGNVKNKFYWLLDVLKPILIRHTKAQRINGSAALALPPSSTTTTLVAMSDVEKGRLRSLVKFHLLSQYRRSGGENAFPLSRALGLLSGYGCRSKLVLLCEDLRSLRLKEPSLRAVVFTQSRETHEAVINTVRRNGFKVLEFSGSTSAKKRDQSIREFQAPSQTPAVFVITMRAGNVGITLTAASRVYLMEPCLDPAVEVQAAGRIHRLGQTKSVHVIRYAFKNSPEHNITKLHNEIIAGKVSITDGFVPRRAIKILANGL